MEILVFIIIWVVCGIGAAKIAESKGHSYGNWFLVGILFGPLALIIIGFIEPNKETDELEYLLTTKKCPFCAEIIKMEAILCRYCGRDLPIDHEALRSNAPRVLSKNDFMQLTFQQQVAVKTYSFLPSPEDAQKAIQMRDREAKIFCQSHGEKVIYSG